MPTSLTQMLETQLAQLEQMNELLLAERQSIIDRNPEATITLSQEKSALLTVLQETDQQITHQFSQQDLTTPEAKALRIKIDDCLVELKRQNEVNGKIIQNGQITTKMLKDILFASKRDPSSMTYNQLGQKKTSSKYKPIKA